MNTRQQLQFRSIIDCQAILEQKEFHRPDLDPLRARFDKAASDVRELYTSQSVAHGSRASDGAELNGLRKNVRQRLLRISRHALAVLEGLPGIREDVRVPHANAKDAELIKAAARITRNLRPHLKTLQENGLARDSFARLQVAVKALKAKIETPNTAIARRSRATASIPPAIRRARTIARALDTIIRAELTSDVVVRWTGAYRIPRKLGRPKKRRAPETTS